MKKVVRNRGGAALRAFVLPLLINTLWLLPAAAQEAVPEVVPEVAEDTTPGIAVDPPSRVARLSHKEGEVIMAPAGTEEWAEAILNRPLTSGDRLWTESGARAELQIGSAAAYLNERTSFAFAELDDDVMQMSLTEGTVTLRIRRLSENEIVRIETPNVAVSLNEPGEYTIEVDPNADRTLVKTRHGEAEIFAGEERHVVRANEQGSFSGLQELLAQVEPLGPRTGFENWANDRERREYESTSAKYVSRDVVGHEDLDDYGDWRHEPEYGHVWYPRHVSYGWTPYRDGRWVWVSPWGWTWVDHAPWGFAPFHYGRWAYVRHRWCWVPGPRHLRPIYAPALVGWIGRPHAGVTLTFGSHIGWFPLAPHEVFVPGYWHSPRYIRRVNHSNTIIVNNTYITNIYAGRHHGANYRYGRLPHAVTAVERGHFLGGRPIRGRILRVSDDDLREWRHQSRPPALAPDRQSVLAGGTRRAPPATRLDRVGLSHRAVSNRVAFDTERSRIEANGGRPIARTHLRAEPQNRGKDRGDVYRGRTRGDVSGATPRVSERTPGSRAGSSRDERLQTSPRQTSRGESSSRVATRAERLDADRETRSSGRSPELQRRSDRDSTASPRINSLRSSGESVRIQRGTQVAPRIEHAPEPRRSIPRTEHRDVEIRSAPRQQLDSGRSSSTRQYTPPARSPRVESSPSRVERAAPSREPSSSSRSFRSSGESRSHSSPRQTNSGGSRSHSISRGGRER